MVADLYLIGAVKATNDDVLRISSVAHVSGILVVKWYRPAPSGGGEDAGPVHWRSLLVFFAAARAGLLWEEREPALFVYFSDQSTCLLIRLPSMFRRI